MPHEESELILLKALIEDDELYGILLEGNVFDIGIPEGYYRAKNIIENVAI